jgi:hypothetical protein
VALMPPDAELARLLDDLRPAELALRDWVRTRLNASIVREIAGLDHGMRVAEHREAIEALLVARRLPEELSWAPGEVLELSSYEVPAGQDVRPDSAAWRGHVARLFSSLVLVRANDTTSPAATLARLIESALELGPEATEGAVRYLAWCRLYEPGAWHDDAEARPFLTFGLLLLYGTAPAPRDPAIAAGLARAFGSEVEALLPGQSWPGQTPTAMLKATARANGWRIWQALADRYLIDGRNMASVETLRTWFGVSDRSGPPP